MRKLICDGKLDIKQAQEEIAKDWIGAYAKYVGPVPGGRPQAEPPKPVQSSSADRVEAKPDVSGNCPPSAPVKVSSNGIYHVPGGSFYNRTTHPKTCFATPEAAEAAGYRAAKQ